MLILGILGIIIIISISQTNSLGLIDEGDKVLNQPTQAIILSNNKIMLKLLGPKDLMEDRPNIIIDKINTSEVKDESIILDKNEFIKEYAKRDNNLQITSYIITIILLSIVFNMLIFSHVTNLVESSISNLSILTSGYVGQGIGVFNNLFIINSHTIIFQTLLLIAALLILINFGKIKYISEFNALNLYNNATLSLIPMLNKKEKESSGIFSLFDYQDNQPKDLVEFIKPSESFILIGLFSILGGLLLINANNLLVLFIAIEVQSYSLYTMGSIYKESYTATDSGLKYFLLGGIASVFILFGCSILYATTGSINIDDLILFIDNNENTNLLGIISGSVCIILGILLKISSAPMHTWSLDVYDGVPTLVTTWFSVLTKISFLGFLSKYINFLMYNNYISNIMNSTNISLSEILYVFLICSMLSMLIGAISGIKESNIKRLLALSGVTNIGYLLLALTNYASDNIDQIGDSTLISSSSFIFYLVQYTIANLNLFLVILIYGYTFFNPSNDDTFAQWRTTYDSYSPIRMINNLIGLFSANPYLAVSFAISIFSLVGIPPLVGFYAKYFIIISSIFSKYYLLVIILIIASVISSFYYLRLIKLIFIPSNKPLVPHNSITTESVYRSSLLTDNYYYNAINNYNIYNITNYLSSNLISSPNKGMLAFNHQVSSSHIAPYMIIIAINTTLLLLFAIYYFPLISLFV